MDATTGKIMQLFDTISKLINNVFHFQEKDQRVMPEPFDDFVRSSIMLSVVVFIIVVMARIQKSQQKYANQNFIVTCYSVGQFLNMNKNYVLYNFVLTIKLQIILLCKSLFTLSICIITVKNLTVLRKLGFHALDLQTNFSSIYWHFDVLEQVKQNEWFGSAIECTMVRCGLSLVLVGRWVVGIFVLIFIFVCVGVLGVCDHANHYNFIEESTRNLPRG